jgi:hypothetical protein
VRLNAIYLVKLGGSNYVARTTRPTHTKTRVQI